MGSRFLEFRNQTYMIEKSVQINLTYYAMSKKRKTGLFDA